jgi:hypothetical protein
VEGGERRAGLRIGDLEGTYLLPLCMRDTMYGSVKLVGGFEERRAVAEERTCTVGCLRRESRTYNCRGSRTLWGLA